MLKEKLRDELNINIYQHISTYLPGCVAEYLGLGFHHDPFMDLSRTSLRPKEDSDDWIHEAVLCRYLKTRAEHCHIMSYLSYL